MPRPLVVTFATLVTAGLVLALVWFEPWRTVSSSDVDEAVPDGEDIVIVDDNPAPRSQEAEDLEAALRGEETFTRGLKEAARAETAERTRDAQRREDQEERRLQEAREPREGDAAVELAAGDFVAAEHATSGRVRILDPTGPRRVLRLEALDTSAGPDLQVWVTDRPSGGSWGSYDDGRQVRLGALTAIEGTSRYRIPAGADLDGMRSVVIWCDRFDVAFGTAPVSL